MCAFFRKVIKWLSIHLLSLAVFIVNSFSKFRLFGWQNYQQPKSKKKRANMWLRISADCYFHQRDYNGIRRHPSPRYVYALHYICSWFLSLVCQTNQNVTYICSVSDISLKMVLRGSKIGCEIPKRCCAATAAIYVRSVTFHLDF